MLSMPPLCDLKWRADDGTLLNFVGNMLSRYKAFSPGIKHEINRGCDFGPSL